MRNKRPVKIITLDTETYDGLLGGLKKIAIYDGVSVTYGDTFSDVEKELEGWYDEGYNVNVYIHNMEFDLRKLPELFSGNKIIWEKSVAINGKLAVVQTKKYTLRDSFKLFPQSLFSLSKGFDVECGKLDLWKEVQKVYPGQYTDHVDFLDRCPIDDELFIKYLGYDVISLYQVIYKAMELLGLTEEEFTGRMSTASLSRFMFKNGYHGKEFMTDGIPDYQTMTAFNWSRAKTDGLPAIEIEAKIREAFCGGRTEVFKPILTGGGYHYDVNSLYPSVMINGDFPIGKPEFYPIPKVAQYQWERWLKGKIGLGFLKCAVFIPDQHIPPLPVKKGKLCFPCGFVEGTWTFTELEYAVNNCGCEIVRYDECILFNQTAKVFHNFVTEFYKIKEQASKDHNTALKTIAKLILNTGYGYTGMRRDDKTSLQPLTKLEKFEEKCVFVNEKAGYIEVESDINAEYIQVQIAAYVTSYARLILLDALRKAAEIGEVYYCDTDSIVTDHAFPPEIVDGDRIGYWDLESTPDAGIFLRPKVYAERYETEDGYDDVIKFKGVSKETQSGMDFDDYGNILKALREMKEDKIPVETGKTVLPSIMVLEKNDLGLDTYYTRDKNMNLNTIEKRLIDYTENYTKPHFFDSLEVFEEFDFFANVEMDVIV